MVEYNDLVAGQGDEGFGDGPFASALFDTPCGLALNAEADHLFVADRLNHRIRVVLLDKDNEVQTLAGSGQAGTKDGPFDQASFDQPARIAFIPPGDLLVYDQETGQLRMLDLKTKTVSTVTAKSSKGEKVETFGRVGAMVYQPEEKAVYFTQPDSGSIDKLEVGNGALSTVLDNRAELPHPLALCLYQDHFCVSDSQSDSVYRLEAGTNSLTASATLTLNLIGKTGHPVAAMAATGSDLYAVPSQENTPWMQVAPPENAGPLKFMSVWGDLLEDGDTRDPQDQVIPLSFLFNFNTDIPGFVADPLDERRFFLSLPKHNVLISLRDYRFDKLKDSQTFKDEKVPGDILDFDYPTAKPPKTFRILMVGDSHTFLMSHEEYKKRWPWGHNRMETVSKRLELILNTIGALTDNPTHFQVLLVGKVASTPLFLWPYYEVPQLVKKYDIDLCLWMISDFPMDYHVFFSNPPTKEGIPALVPDPEYYLKPLKERMNQSPLLRDFYDQCLADHLGDDAHPDSFAPSFRIMEDPKIRDDFMEMMGKPAELLDRKIQGMKTSSGKPVPLYLCFLPQGNLGEGEDAAGKDPNGPYRLFWRDICRRKGLNFMDISDSLNVLKASFYPTAEFYLRHHFDHNGHILLAAVLAHELIFEKLIPFESQPTP